MKRVTIKAKLVNITYPRAVNCGDVTIPGFAVEKYMLLEDCLPFKKGDTVTIIGDSLPIAKITYIITGQMIWDKQYGLQIKADVFEELPVDTDEGIIELLTSRTKGLGPRSANAIIEMFGSDTINVIENDYKRLEEVKGVSHKKASAIHKVYLEHKEIPEIVHLLAPFGFSYTNIAKIFNEYQEKTLDVIRKTPFELCKITGVGFDVVDDFAKTMNHPGNADDRVEAALYAAIKANESNGHTFGDVTIINKMASDMLDCKEVTSVQMKRVLRKMNESKRIMIGESKDSRQKIVYSASTAKSEMYGARNLAHLVHAKTSTGISINSINLWENRNRIKLSNEQKLAVENSLNNTVSVITGGPGTGKTTIIKCIADELISMGKSILMLAPTGCAARRITYSTKYMAYTIHSALAIKPEEDGTVTSPIHYLNADAVIVDESSMIDIHLADALLRAIKPGTQLVLIGDANQLPSVGPGSVFSDIINSGVVPVSRLTNVYRTSGSGIIAKNAAKICAGDTELTFDNKSFMFVEAQTESETLEKMKDIYLQTLSDYSPEEVAMLSPFKDKSTVCVSELNKAVHDLVNRASEKKMEVKVGNRIFRQGDLIMQTKNTKEASNGEIGRITSISISEKIFTVNFSSKIVTYPFSAFEMFDYAYSLSIHKSQGSEYEVVIIDILKIHNVMLARNLIYTGITRAKKKVIIVGQKEALETAILNTNYSRRNTFFCSRLKCILNAL